MSLESYHYGLIDEVIETLERMTPENRVLLLESFTDAFCHHCGRKHPDERRTCQCENDE